jgi:two-component system chemotaxis response regulator CheY
MQALVVDDSRAMRMVLSRMLTGLDFEVQDAPDGPTALDLVRAGPPFDLVMVDWHMPQMEGIEVVAGLRALGFAGRIVMVTTETEMAQMARALDAGADEYLMKPFTAEAVTEKLRLLDLA